MAAALTTGSETGSRVTYPVTSGTTLKPPIPARVTDNSLVCF